jgi:hypothetical protein
MKPSRLKFLLTKQEVVLFIIKMERYYSFSGTENGFTQGGTEKGEDIEGTSMREVEEETGVNQPALYENFKKPTTFSSATVFTKLHTGLKCNLILREPWGNLRKESKK